MTHKISSISFWKMLRKVTVKLKTLTRFQLLVVLFLSILALCSCSFPPIQKLETAPPETFLPTAFPQETAGQSANTGGISNIEPYLSCLGASALEISSSFSTSPFDKWEYGGWDGGSPYFMDEADGIVYYFAWLDAPSDDSLVYLTADTKCVQIAFPCSQIYDAPSSMSKADLEEMWGQLFSADENIEDETWGLYTLWDGHYEIRISCTEKMSLTENSYISIIDRNLIQEVNEEETQIKDIPPKDLILSMQVNSYLLAVAHPIELAYVEEAEQVSGTTAEACQMYAKYQSLWEEEINKYQALIEAEFEDVPDLLGCFQESLDNWRSTTEHDVALYIELEKCLHKDGTITTPNVLRFTMEQYRAKALQLISIYDEIMVGRGWSWKNQLLEDVGS